MTLGAFRKLTEDVGDDVEILFTDNSDGDGDTPDSINNVKKMLLNIIYDELFTVERAREEIADEDSDYEFEKEDFVKVIVLTA